MSKVMSLDMYNFIKDNEHRLQYDLENGLIISSKGTNGTICSSTGYLRVRVGKKILQVHQVLSVKYFGEKCIGMQINHKDGDKLNNRKSNLEVCTQLENLNHQIESGLRGKIKAQPKKRKSVDKLDLDGNYICTYSSIKEASESIGLKSNSGISYAIKGFDGRNKPVESAGGYKWRYSE